MKFLTNLASIYRADFKMNSLKKVCGRKAVVGYPSFPGTVRG